MNTNNQSDDNYERLQRLMEGDTHTAENISHRDDPFTLILRNAQVAGLGIVFVLLCVFYGVQYYQTRPPYSYSVNPVSKMVLKYKALEYIEDEYPDFSEDADVNINNGIVKFKKGYMVICKDGNGQLVSVYFDKLFRFTHDSPSIKK